ncbi:MAG: patatin-like phospholipase family protein [Pseudolabrys sp.]
MDVARKSQSRSPNVPLKHDHTVLVLQGGGSLGAYQAGAYEGLAEAGVIPDWIAGVSIGAVNAALIAGNPPERRVERLREFWNRVSAIAPFVPPASVGPLRSAFNGLSVAAATAFGVPGFFTPRMPSALFGRAEDDSTSSVYQTDMLKSTLEELVDFDLVNHGDVRLSLGAVNVKAGNSIYFDNRQTRIGSDHVRASGALPPGFPSVKIDGEYYWDGGLVSNTPLWYVLDDSPQMNALIVQVDLFNMQGELPDSLDRVMERDKDIRYSSKTRFNTRRVKELAELRAALCRLLAKLPPTLASDADAKLLAEAGKAGQVTIAHLINRRLPYSSQSKDCEFSRATVTELWAAGLADVRRAAANRDWAEPEELWEGMRVYDLTK